MPLRKRQHQIPYQWLCAICREPVNLSTAKTDEDGQVVHDQCYFVKICDTKKPCATVKTGVRIA